MEENKKVSPILIVILSILGICLVGFLVWYGINYFKGEDKPTDEPSSQTIDEPSTQTIDEPGSYIENAELASEFSKIHKFAYDYFLTWPYCGEYEAITVDDPVYDMQGISKDFKSFDELYNYLKKYMSNDVINQNTHTVKENYYIKDGKLYCKFDAKGWVYEYQSSKVNILTLTDKKAETKIIIRSKDEEDILIEYFDVTFEKINDNWIITKYISSGVDYEK